MYLFYRRSYPNTLFSLVDYKSVFTHTSKLHFPGGLFGYVYLTEVLIVHNIYALMLIDTFLIVYLFDCWCDSLN